MADGETYREQRIREETAKVSAESYQKTASLGGWAGGGRTFWALSVIGAVAGAAIGLVAPFFPLMALGFTAAAAKTAMGAVGASIAVFAATGMSTGFAGGLVLGRISGVGGAVAQEQEKRLKQWMVKQKLTDNPNAEIAPDEPKEAPAPKSLWNRIKDTYRTYVNPKVGLTMAAIGAAGGLLMAAAFVATGGASFAIMPALTAITGLEAAVIASPPVIAAYSAGVMGAFGALFTVNMPKIASDTAAFFGDLISGKLYEREWGPKKEKEKEKTVALSPEPSQAKENEALADKAIASAKFTRDRKPMGSYCQMANSQSAEPTAALRG